MKIVKAIIAVVVIAAVAFAGFAYFTSPEVKIVGEWEGEYTDFVFDKEGKVKVTYLDTTIPGIQTPVTGTYEGDYTIVKEGKVSTLTIKTTVKVFVEVHLEDTYELSFEDGNMVLTRVYKDGSKGEPSTFTKQG